MEALPLVSGNGLPSRRAFSRAAFSARAFLSASICAFIAARAFASSSFSVYDRSCVVSFRLRGLARRGVLVHTFSLGFRFFDRLLCLEVLPYRAHILCYIRTTALNRVQSRAAHLARFSPYSLVCLVLLRSFLRFRRPLGCHLLPQLCEFLFLLFFSQGLDLYDPRTTPSPSIDNRARSTGCQRRLQKARHAEPRTSSVDSSNWSCPLFSAWNCASAVFLNILPQSEHLMLYPDL